jgi:hypothetical protein
VYETPLAVRPTYLELGGSEARELAGGSDARVRERNGSVREKGKSRKRSAYGVVVRRGGAWCAG